VNVLTLSADELPTDTHVCSYEASETLSAPFSINVEFRTADETFRVESCLQRRVLLQVRDALDTVRYYDGLPDEVGFVAYRAEQYYFRLRLRPALAVLEHREGSRIFQDKSPVDVVKQILAEAGVDGDVQWQLRQSYAPREFLCQYRETELDFVHRLLEQEGIFYFFLHSADGHKLVLADDSGAFGAPAGVDPVVLSTQQAAGTQPLVGFERSKRLRPTEVTLRDYDFEKPDVFPSATVPGPGAWPIRHFEYPAGFVVSAEGTRKAARRLSALRRDVDVCRGTSQAVGLACGTPLRVQGAHEAVLNGEFIVTELHSTGSDHAEGAQNEFVAIPKDAPYAAAHRAAKPKIRGLQTAVVTGPSNAPQAIEVDKYGRIKVRMLWDRSGKQDDTSSCWLRVSQLALGGSMVLPRVGWEMAVAFLQGDPDRPIVLGRTYNAEHATPYTLPAAAAEGALKSMATPGGAGHNKMKMSDTTGSQGLSISAQKDLNITTGHDKTETIGNNEQHRIGSNYNITIGANETTKVGGNQSINVGNALQVKVKGTQSTSVGGNDQLHAKCDLVEKVAGTHDYRVGGNQITISCGVRQQLSDAFKRDVGSVQVNMSLASIDDTMLGTYDENVGAIIAELVHGDVAESVGGNKDATSLAAELHIVAGMSTSAKGVKQLVGGVHLRKLGGDFKVTAPTIILGGGIGKFTGGGSAINLNGGPVTIKGSKIAIEATAIVHLGANLKIG